MALPRWFSRYLGLATEVIAPVDAAQLFVRHGDERLLLHIGCGPAGLPNLPTGFQQGFREIRVDLDTDARPDLIASFSYLSCVPDASVEAAIEKGKSFMQHKCGFTLRTLNEAVRAAGFAATFGIRRPDAFDLWLLACSLPTAEATLKNLASRYLVAHDM